MNRYAERLAGRVVVVTGATAGVGRATVQAFARHGAKLGLLARDAAALAELRESLVAQGIEVWTGAVDVADADAVFRAARDCEAALGPLEVWVNDAMVTVFSPVATLDVAELRRVTEVTYLGAVHGTMAALRTMRPRGRGVIVQVGSALAYRGIPLQAAYCGAKHALRGFTDSLRGELLGEGSRVQVTAVHLPAINTPQFDWARTHRTHEPRPVAPVYDASVAADAIVKAACRPRREYWLGRPTVLTILGNAVAPAIVDRVLARRAIEGQDRPASTAPDRADNLFAPVAGAHRTDGSFSAEARPRAVLLDEVSARAGVLALAVTGFLGLGMLLGSAWTTKRTGAPR
jgi:short-subunit dehydrogenase